jgi:two-component system, sensor histidine kinase and response regulator
MTEPLRLLVVDDELGIRLAIKRTLQDYTIRLPDFEGEMSFEVELAESGEEALVKIESFKPDMLLLDHKLPAMSGIDVLDWLSKKDFDLITVMITAYASLETAITATKRGAFDFLAKPFTPDELTAALYKSAKHLMLERRAHQLAQEKRQLRFQLISMVSHELKAPLAALLGYLGALKEPSIVSKPAVYDDIIERSQIRLQGMRKLIQDLLDLTSIESGQKKRELVPLDVLEIARQTVEAVRPEARERNITIDLHESPSVTMTADRGEIEIVFNNLLTNAVKYNRQGGRVEVGIESKDERVILRVTDTGIGMTPEEAGRLFAEFVRIRNEKTRDILGSGLGLSIVKKIALLYGGDISVSSQPDVGSTFSVTLLQAHPAATP